MWYVYVLQSLKNKRLYTGLTGDLKRRFGEHNAKQGGKYTSKVAPFKLIYYEAYLNKPDASAAEKFYKSGYGREVFKEKVKSYLN
ncbi:MAG: GIY-YIG nuclease family protein [Candidatus Buchananbacteria bacterium]